MSSNLTRREQAEQLLNEANMRRYLDLLSYAEGTEKHGYNTTFGGKRWEDLSYHPNKVWGRTKDGATTATGRYQFLGGTWKEQAQKLGLKDFGNHSQDLAAVSLIMQRGAVDDILKGDIDTANRKLSTIWASLPYHGSKNQPHRTVEELEKKWQQLQMSGGLGSMDGQQYDYSTTQPQPIAQAFSPPAVSSEVSQMASAFKPTRTAEQTGDLANSFVDQITKINSTLSPLDSLQPETETPKQSNRQKYQAQLAEAFGVQPETNNGLPDYISELVRSVYDGIA